MDKMPELIAEHGLALLKFHPDGEKVERDDFPEFESVTLTARSENPALPPPGEAKSQAGPKVAYHQGYSV
jgi:hypothetical protein